MSRDRNSWRSLFARVGDRCGPRPRSGRAVGIRGNIFGARVDRVFRGAVPREELVALLDAGGYARYDGSSCASCTALTFK